MIQLTAAAIQEINRLRDRQNLAQANFRLGIRSSSCAQWAYQMTFESAAAEPATDDDVYICGSIRVVVSQTDRTYLENLKIDFSEDLMGGAFRFDNPQATENCRCGYAFAIAPASHPDEQSLVGNPNPPG